MRKAKYGMLNKRSVEVLDETIRQNKEIMIKYKDGV